jgi:hypothetical protein
VSVPSKATEQNIDVAIVANDNNVVMKDPQDQVEESEYPSTFKLAGILVSLVFTTFLVCLCTP